MAKLRVAVVSNELLPISPTGGALERLAHVWARSATTEHEVAIVHFPPLSGALPLHDPGSLRYVELDSPLHLEELQRNGRYDLFVFHNRPHWSTMIEVPSLAILHNYHGAWTSSRDPLSSIGADARVQRGRSCIPVAVSRPLAAASSSHLVGEPTVEVLPPFVDPSFTQMTPPDPGIPGRNILFPNRLMPKKGVWETLHALELSPPGTFSISFVEYVSPNVAPDAEQRRMISKIRSTAGARLIPRALGPTATAALFRSFDAVITPSVEPEGFGLVPAESLAIGLRTGIPNVGGLSEFLFAATQILEPSEPQHLSRQFGHLLEGAPPSPQLIAEIRSRYSQERSCSRYVELCDLAAG